MLYVLLFVPYYLHSVLSGDLHAAESRDDDITEVMVQVHVGTVLVVLKGV